MAAGVAIFLAAAIVIPWRSTAADTFFWSTVAIQALYAMSVNLLLGCTGLPSFGQAAFLGLGAYAVAMLSAHGWSTLPALGGAIVLGGFAALVVGAISLRASGLAFAMLTLAFAQALYTLTFHLQSVGGETGLSGVVATPVLGIDIGRPAPYWGFTLFWVCLGIGFLWLIVSSPFGLTLRMIRDDPLRTTFLGIAVRRYQLAAFAIAGALGGLAGGLFAYVEAVVTPDYLFWTRSGEPIIMALIGGMDTFFGPVVGAIIYMWTFNFLTKITQAWTLWVGLVFLAIVLFFPRGLLGFVRSRTRLAS